MASTPRRLWYTGLALLAGLILYGAFRFFSAPTGSDRPAVEAAASAPTGKQLYENHCLQCHGEQGTGDGPAARVLYPKPRDFSEAKFRLVTTDNRMPSDQDLDRVITHGMPGSAMVPFAHLSEAKRQALANYVRELAVAGIVEKRKATLGPNDDLAELTDTVKEYLQPGRPLEAVVQAAPSGTESVARGAKLFQEQGCVACHGLTGKGDGVQDQRDDRGLPTRPRDFTQGIFKGGRDSAQLHARIVLGMPGTPMPSSGANVKPDQVADMIAYILSLSSPDAAAKFEHQRRQIIVPRSASSLTSVLTEDAWQAAAVPIVVSPLWWRTYVPPELTVRALHDGQTIAVRLEWKDDSCNASSVRPQDFEDMAAVQLFRGTPEPFLGMGGLNQAVDVWLWRAGWTGEIAQRHDVESTYPHMAVDFYPFEKTGPRPHGVENQAEPFVTARDAGNLHADPMRTFTGNNLQSQRFGSLTMRPRTSQVVQARGVWKDGRWTVVFQRALNPGADAGLTLAAGDKLSIAFALWDGAAGDRNGQKLVSIWHDLQLQ